MVRSINIFVFLFFKVIAQQVSDKHLEEGRLYPPLNTIRDISLKIAEKVKHSCPTSLFSLSSMAKYAFLGIKNPS